MSISTYTVDSTKIVKHTKVDFGKPTFIQDTVRFTQYDKTLPILAVSLYIDGEAYTLPASADLNIRWGKRDRTFSYNPALGCNSDRTVAYFEITSQMTSIDGMISPIIELAISGAIAGSSPIPVVIDRNPIQDGDTRSAIESGVLLSRLIETTYADLVSKVNEKKLIPGQQYRITDYKPTNSGTDGTGRDFKMAGHQFDIIVTADDSATLNANARAAMHEGDTYFASSNLAEWKLKYYIKNDVTKFDWADANGHGVIYYMIDEHNNECRYDFKNVMFKRYDVSDFTLVHGQYYNDYSQQKETWFNSVKSTLPFKFYEGFGNMATGQKAVDIGYPDLLAADEQTILESGLTYVIIDDPEYYGDPGLIGTFDARNAKYVWFYTFSIYANETVSDRTLAKGCHDNRISVEGLSHNIVISQNDNDNCYSNTFGDNCSSNTFGNNCYSNTFGNNCSSNTFGDSCYSNTFGNNCYYDTFGNECYSNTFGNNCYYDTFGNNCYSNTFGNICSYNTFGNNCSYNTFGNECYSNTFGYNCYSNTFGNNCSHNTFGNECYSNTFGDDCYYDTFGTKASPIGYCRHNIFDAGIVYLNLTSDDTTAGYNNYLQNVRVCLGIRGSSDANCLTITVADRALAYETVYKAAGSTEIILS
jgi:hypothetical protein